MTINKAQGQTLDRVGLDLRDDVFAHGQLYVALSRARCAANIMVLLKDDRIESNGTGLTANAITPAFVDAAIAGTPEESSVTAAREAASQAALATSTLQARPTLGAAAPLPPTNATTRSGRRIVPSQRLQEMVRTIHQGSLDPFLHQAVKAS